MCVPFFIVVDIVKARIWNGGSLYYNCERPEEYLTKSEVFLTQPNVARYYRKSVFYRHLYSAYITLQKKILSEKIGRFAMSLYLLVITNLARRDSKVANIKELEHCASICYI